MSAADLAYVVMDLETSGLDERNGVILEIAAVGLDSHFQEVFRYSTPITQDDDMLFPMDRTVADMHAKSGLMEDLLALSSPLEHPLLDLTDDAGKYIHPFIDTADDMLSAVIHASAEDTVLLCGSGVSHFDKRWLAYHMPKTHSCFKHYTIDVGCMRRLYRAVVGDDLSLADQAKTHRALDDVDCHIEELMEFSALFVRDALFRDQLFAEPEEEIAA